MQARDVDGDRTPTSKKPRRVDEEMPPTDVSATDDSLLFPMEEIAHYPLPGYIAPSSISFSPDDRLISYLFSPDGNLYRKVFTFDLASRRQDLIFSPPGGGLDESNLSAEEKLRRERSRERGLGVTRYEWRDRSSSRTKHSIMVPLPSGVYFQDLAGSEPELKLSGEDGSPVIDPHLSPDGGKLAFVRDDELYVLNLSGGEPMQLTFGARGSGKVRRKVLLVDQTNVFIPSMVG